MQLRNGCVAYTAFWIVDNTQNAVVVAWIYGDTHVRKSVLYLLALIETEAAKHLVGYAVQVEFFFKTAGYGVCTHQNRHLAVRRAFAMQHVDRPCNSRCLVTVVVRLVILYAVVLVDLAPKRLFVAVGVVFDDVVCGFENGRGAAIVLLEFEHFCALKVFRKIQNVANFRAAPAVYGLIFVTHNKQIAVLF